VKDQKAVISEDSDKRSGTKGVGPGLGEEKLIVLGPFQVDPLGAGREIMIVAGQVLFGVFQVAVVGDALGQSVINSLVGEQEVIVDGGEVDIKGEAQEKEKNQEDDAKCGPFLLEHQENRP
jgi:hypothetical protein